MNLSLMARSVVRNVSLVVLLSAAAVEATPRFFPFTYHPDTLEAGAVEVEQFVDITTLRALDGSGAPTWEPQIALNTEVEVGLARHVELGLYLVLESSPSDSVPGPAPLRIAGGKARVRWQLADEGEWPVDLALYGEVEALVDEIGIEAKVIVQKRFGPVRLVANLAAEHEWHFDGGREWVINPTVGASFEIIPMLHVGVESWLRAEIPNVVPTDAQEIFNVAPKVFVGPVALLQLSKFWLSAGVYARADAVNRPVQLGDEYGRLWVRLALGVDL